MATNQLLTADNQQLELQLVTLEIAVKWRWWTTISLMGSA
jgi:hypothetical protein